MKPRPKNALKHGQCGTPTYKSWVSMWGRVRSTDAKKKRFYGGVKVCDRWGSFEMFLEDMGERPAGTTLDRIDGALGYDPSNCRWATPVQQARNRRNNRLLPLDGEMLTLAEAAERVGLKQDTLSKRLSYGWSIERALTTGVRTWK